MTKTRSYSREYHRSRAVILEGQPPCYWCGAPATTADHVIAKHHGGDDTLENLVPACLSCNSSRGAKLINLERGRTKRATTKPKANTTKPRTKPNPQKFLGDETGHPGRSHKESLSESKDTGIGHELPRLEAMRRDTEGSFAQRAAELYHDLLGMQLMAWQLRALAGLLAFDKQGKLAHRISLVSVARQNGKTTAMQALILWWLLERPRTHGPQRVVTSAHRFEIAKVNFGVLAPLLVERFGAKAMWSHGRESIRMPDGSQWLLVASKPMAGHGLSPDLIVLDEAWAVSDEVIDGAFLPSQRARPEPLFSMWSTAGTEDSRAMQRWRDQGIAAIDQPSQMHFAEWSPPAGSSEFDPETWRYANPALGVTIQPEQLALELDAPNRAQFLRASLNMWVSAEQAWLPPGTWPELTAPEPELKGGTVFMESRTGESRYFLLRAVRDGDGVYVKYLGERRSLRDTWAEITEMLEHDQELLAHVGAGLESSVPSALERRVQLVGRREMLSGTRFARAMIGEGRVHHCGSSVLGDHVARAVALEMGGGYTISAKASPGPVELARCVVWAVSALGREEKRRERPAVVVARR